MASVFDVASYILEKAGRISTWKLQKLCYYAQAWSVAWTEEPLFGEEIQAWSNGPVCPVLFRAHKGKYMIEREDLSGDSQNLDEDQKDTIDRVLGYYGSWDPYQLREQTHAEAPWKNARGNIPDCVSSDSPITVESMGEYYGAL